MLEIQTTNEQKAFHLAEWLMRPRTMVSASGFSSTPLCATNTANNYILWSATMMVIDSGVAGGAGEAGATIWGDINCFFFLLRPKTCWLVGKDLIFWSSYTFGLKNQLRFAAKTFSFFFLFFFFLVFTYILADKGCHHEIPLRVPPFLATPLVIDTVSSFYIFFFATEDPAPLLYSSQID